MTNNTIIYWFYFSTHLVRAFFSSIITAKFVAAFIHFFILYVLYFRHTHVYIYTYIYIQIQIYVQFKVLNFFFCKIFIKQDIFLERWFSRVKKVQRVVSKISTINERKENLNLKQKSLANSCIILINLLNKATIKCG